MNAMGPVIPFKRSGVTFALATAAAAVVAFVATMAFLNWKAAPAVQHPAIQQNEVTILRPELRPSGPIDVIDGDTVRPRGLHLSPGRLRHARAGGQGTMQ